MAEKTTRVLAVILFAFVLILVRVWYLGVVQHEEHEERALRPKRKTVVEKVERGTIRDRFNSPLALNTIQYNAAVCYADIRNIPSGRWVMEGSKRVRVQTRLQHIRLLAELLAGELEIPAQEIEDIIHAKASLFPHTPFVIKENVTEAQYYRLKALEKDWAGIRMERGSRRYYPQGKVGCDVVGYLGAISGREYAQVACELARLNAYLEARERGEAPVLPKGLKNPLEVRERVRALEERAYTINDVVGKAGIEGGADPALRGYAGRTVYEVDTKGNVVRELPGARRSVGGQRHLLTLSAELQEYAEQLLIENEAVRERRHPEGEPDLSEPWIKGGAIVALDPKTGEVLALASYPRMDPNDFVTSNVRVAQWLESESYIGAVWDGKRPLERERWNGEVITEELWLTWDHYLEAILPTAHPVRAQLQVMTALDALQVQRAPEEYPTLLVDLCRLVAPLEHTPPACAPGLAQLTLAQYREMTQLACGFKEEVKRRAREQFHSGPFQDYRQTHFKAVLKEKRREEREKRRYARPYTEYLEQMEKEQFALFWERERENLLTRTLQGEKLRGYLRLFPEETWGALLSSLRSFNELTEPLSGKYRALRQHKGAQLQKHLAAAFYPVSGYGHGRSQAYRQSTPLGSIFKLVIAYHALVHQFERIRTFTIVDKLQAAPYPGSPDQVLGYTAAGKPIPRLYKGGWIPRSHLNIGSIDVRGALEQSSNLYFALLAAESDPLALLETTRAVGFGEKTGIELPGEIVGALPRDFPYNRTGLYTFAIGQHSLVVTPLQTAVMLSALAGGGEVLQPKIVHTIAGAESFSTYQDPFEQEEYAYKEPLASVGIHFPLFTATVRGSQETLVWRAEKERVRHLHTPPAVREILVDAMDRVLTGAKGTARPQIIRLLAQHPDWVRNYYNLQHQLIGKTSTAEILYKHTIDPESKAVIRDHIWFGGVAFSEADEQRWEDPELTIVVYLRFSSAGGREAAPLAAQVVKKWREIKRRHGV